MSSVSSEPILVRRSADLGRRELAWLSKTGTHISRYSLVLMLLWFGLQKFTAAEAAGIQILVSHSPFMRWMYSLWGLQTVSNLIGVVEVTVAILIATRPFSAKASFVGSVGSILTFLATVSFLFTTPGVLDHTHAIPFLDGLGGFLVKDLSLLGCAVWTAAEAWDASRQNA